MFFTVGFEPIFVKYFFGYINYQSREHILSTRASDAHTGCVALNMSDDDRAAKAARAKALVRLFLSEMQPPNPPSRSSTKRGSKRNQVRARASQRHQRQAHRWSELFPLPLWTY